MAQEAVTTTITRPAIFPECQNCPLALDQIRFQLGAKYPEPHLSDRTTTITVLCDVQEKRVEMITLASQAVRFAQNGPMVRTESPITAKEVRCPHFQ